MAVAGHLAEDTFMSTQATGRPGLWPVVVAGLIVAAGLVLAAPSAEAVPAFARQLNTKCSTCHSPVPPRLNNLGIIFKRSGYRLPDSDDKDRLVLKEKPSRSPFDDLSLVGDFRGESGRGEPTAFVLDEVEAMGAGSLSPRFSYAFQAAWDRGEVELEGLEGQVLLGRPTANVLARFGLLAPRLWEKWNHQRLTVSRPLLVSARTPAGEFAGFRWQENLPGVEVGATFNNLAAEGGALRSTSFTLGVFNGLAQREDAVAVDENNDFKDVMLQTMHVWGDSNTVGALYYRGKVTDIGDERFGDRLDRWALVGNYRLPVGTDFVAGVGAGKDRTTQREIGTLESRGWFLEVDQPMGASMVAVVRYDQFEPDRVRSALDLRGPTVSATHHLFDNLLLTVEYRGLRRGDEPRGRDLVVRAVVIY